MVKAGKRLELFRDECSWGGCGELGPCPGPHLSTGDAALNLQGKNEKSGAVLVLEYLGFHRSWFPSVVNGVRPSVLLF